MPPSLRETRRQRRRLLFAFVGGAFLLVVLGVTLVLRQVTANVEWAALVPQHYRSLVLIALWIWLWAGNIWLLESAGVAAVEMVLGGGGSTNRPGNASALHQRKRSDGDGVDELGRRRESSDGDSSIAMHTLHHSTLQTVPGSSAEVAAPILASSTVPNSQWSSQESISNKALAKAGASIPASTTPTYTPGMAPTNPSFTSRHGSIASQRGSIASMGGYGFGGVSGTPRPSTAISTASIVMSSSRPGTAGASPAGFITKKRPSSPHRLGTGDNEGMSISAEDGMGLTSLPPLRLPPAITEMSPIAASPDAGDAMISMALDGAKPSSTTITSLPSSVSSASFDNAVLSDEIDPTGKEPTSVLPQFYHREIYKIALGATVIAAFVIWISSLLTSADEKIVGNDGVDTENTGVENNVFHVDVTTFTTVSYLVIFGIVVFPLNVFGRHERFRFLRALGRLIYPFSLSVSTPVKFSDIVLADVLTSFARVFGDVVVVFCCILFQEVADDGHLLAKSCATTAVLPLVISTPYLIRLRQCLSDYHRNPTANRLQLWNALKYSTIFPVLVSGYALRVAPSSRLNALWLFCQVVNSAYSFYWDVVFDWKLLQRGARFPLLRDNLLYSYTNVIPSRRNRFMRTIIPLSAWSLKSPTMSPLNPFPIINGVPPTAASTVLSSLSVQAQHRPSSAYAAAYSASPRLPPMAAGPRSSITPLPAAHYPSPTLYFLAIAFNLVARFAWALRLWMLRAGFNLDTEFSLFALQVLELFRRAVWVFFRFEKQELARRHLL